jgi:hypothetical protein
VNVQEKVATLEALLARVKKNAGLPRDVRPYYEDGAAFPAIASAGEIAPGTPELAVLAAPPVIVDSIDEAQPMLVEAIDAIDEAEPMLVEAIEEITEARPVAPTPKEAPAERPLRVEAEASSERPRLVALAPPIGMSAPANKSAEAAKPPARPTAPRPLIPPKPPELTPAAKVEPAAAAKLVERVPPPPPLPVPRVEPPPLPPKPARPTPKIEPAIFASNALDKPTDHALPVAAIEKAAEKTEPIIAVARQEQHRAPGGLWPATADTLPMDYPSSSDEVTKPAEPTEKLLGRTLPKIRSAEDEELSSAETKLMVGPIPGDAIPPFGEEATVVDEMLLPAALGRSDDALAALQGVTASPLPKLHEPDESDAETQLIPSSRRRPTPAVTPPKPEGAPIVARADEAAILGVPGPAVGLPPMTEPAVLPDRPAPVPVPEPVAAKADEPPIGLPKPVPAEANVPPPPPVQMPLPVVGGRVGNRRPALPLVALGIAAAMLIGSTVFVGFRNGWFTKVAPPKPTATPSVIRLPPVSPRGSAAALSPSGTASAAPGPTSEGSAKVPSSPTGSAAATAPSAVESASAAPTTSAAPTAPSTAASVTPPAPEGDGTNLPANRGYLLITSAVPASVYANGVFVGLTGQKIDVECGPKYIRLGALAAPGAPPPKPPLITWLSEGRSSTVACKTVTDIKLDARSQ